jgi:hypothetical protein
MVIGQKDRCFRVPMALAILIFCALLTTVSATADPISEPAVAPSDLASAMAQYRINLKAYTEAQKIYAAAVSAYWSSIDQKRQTRAAKRAIKTQISLDDYVLTQPPVYTGPPEPPTPSPPSKQPPATPQAVIPVVSDFLAAAQQEYNFVPRKPRSEIEFKRAYAKAASAAGLTREQVVRIYGFEATGNGTYDVQAGLEYNKPGEHAVTTALGYNQLLATNSVELMAENGDQFLKNLNARIGQLSDKAAQALQSKITIVQAMIAFSKSVPDEWVQHQTLAGTPKGLGIHAMNLDLDVGPLLQAQQLLNSVLFARAKGYTATLSAAELEMMNLTGDGNGFDMITMPMAWRSQVPTANFFGHGGYEDNPVVQRNNVVSSLIATTDAEMDEEVKKQGALALAAAFPNKSSE